MVLALVLSALRTAVTRLAPTILPFVKTTLSKVTSFVVKKPIKTSALLLGGGFLAASPTARKTLLTAPKSLIETGQIAGAKFETAVEADREPDSGISKALKIGGTAGLIAAGAILAKRAIKKKAAASAIAASPVQQSVARSVETLPSTAQAPLLSGGGITPIGAVTPVKSKVLKPRRAAQKRRESPVFINQIQISN